MDWACPKEHVTDILSDCDRSTEVAPATLISQEFVLDCHSLGKYDGVRMAV